ncbi:MAG: penicillin-binding protein 2 [Halocynthiibacter sp.]
MKRSDREAELCQKKFTRRALLLGATQIVFGAGLAFRMRQLQVEDADEYRLLAEENRINIRLLPPARGRIYDRDGRAIAINVRNYRVFMVREEAGDAKQVLAHLAMLIDLPQEKIDATLETMKTRRAFVPVAVTDNLTWEDLAHIAANAPALPGIYSELALSRRYPLGEDFAHIVGYVGHVSDYDLARIDDKDPLLQIPRFQIGKFGVETKMEKSLRGKAGVKRIEVNALGRVMRELDRQEGDPGDNLQITVDSWLQNYVQARLNGESASAVVMDIHTGDILASGSAPTFDPNLFVHGISSKDYKALNDDPYRPFSSKSVQGTYPPGSTFKMVTALAALDAGVIKTDTRFTCKGHLEVHSRKFHCWKRAGHGSVDLERSLRESCDVYYYEIAQLTGIERITKMARRLGLGERHDIPLTAVAKGLTPTKDWKRKVKKKDWVVGDSLNASIGQGFVLASPLQLAIMTARLARGTAVTPRLLKSINGIETPKQGGGDLGIDPAHLAAVQNGMFSVSNHRRGTAFGSRIATKDYRMAGKTGTSQVRNITKAERKRGVTRNEDLPWERRDHALFVAYAPVDNPKYAVSVVVEHGGGGSKVAAPIARDIMIAAQTGEVPSLSHYPAGQHHKIRSQQRKLILRDPDTVLDESDQA